jgi:serine/threonine protein kinase
VNGGAARQDFGLARMLTHKCDTLPSLAPADGASVVGTHGYVAPEYSSTGAKTCPESCCTMALKWSCAPVPRARARAGELSQATDVYAVGVLLLELLTGLPAADGGRAPGRHLLADALAPHLGDTDALQARLRRRPGSSISSQMYQEPACASAKLHATSGVERPSALQTTPHAHWASLLSLP